MRIDPHVAARAVNIIPKRISDLELLDTSAHQPTIRYGFVRAAV